MIWSCHSRRFYEFSIKWFDKFVWSVERFYSLLIIHAMELKWISIKYLKIIIARHSCDAAIISTTIALNPSEPSNNWGLVGFLRPSGSVLLDIHPGIKLDSMLSWIQVVNEWINRWLSVYKLFLSIIIAHSVRFQSKILTQGVFLWHSNWNGNCKFGVFIHKWMNNPESLTRWTYLEFFQRYRVLARSNEINRKNMKQTCQNILSIIIQVLTITSSLLELSNTSSSIVIIIIKTSVTVVNVTICKQCST